MVYIRRYLSGQQATTVTIAQGAITTDKIVDKAVTQPKVADDAITSDKIADGTIEPADIKASAVETTKIKDAAVTTPKIADGAVTTQKLEAAIQGIARPLTPGVASDEIAALAVVESKIGDQAVATAKIKDGNVSAAKLAADSVEEVKIKDGAVSTDKIAGGAVDQTKIGVDAVTGSEIQNGSVGVTELATDSVVTVKVKDRNITTEKIAVDGVRTDNLIADAVTTAKIVDGDITEQLIHTGAVTKTKIAEPAVDRVQIYPRAVTIDKTKPTLFRGFHDDFVGPVAGSRWVKTVTAGGLFTPDTESTLKLTTGAVSGDKARLDWGVVKGAGLTLSRLIKLIAFFPHVDGVDYLSFRVGLYYDDNNYADFFAEDLAGGAAVIHARAKKAGLAFDSNTGINHASDKLFEIDFEGAAYIVYYINGVEVARNITADYVPDVTCEPIIEIVTRTAATRSVRVDYLNLLEAREGNG